MDIPNIGLGTWQMTSEETEQSVEWALQCGIRLFDTAFLYHNEAAIGKVLNRWIKDGKVDRGDLFVVTKLPLQGMMPERVEKYMDLSLKNLELSYVDLYIIQCPIGCKEFEDNVNMSNNKLIFETAEHPAIWREMEQLVMNKKTKFIGVSNFSSEQLDTISKNATIPISVNQVECHVYFQQKKLRITMDRLGIKLMAYAPLGSPGYKSNEHICAIEDGYVEEIAKKHRKSPAQVVLRYLVDSGFVVIPKSVHKERIEENARLFDFELDENDISKLMELDKGSFARKFKFVSMKGNTDEKTLKVYPFVGMDNY